MKKLVLLFFFLLPIAAFAQQGGNPTIGIPMNGQTVDVVGFLTDAVDQFTGQYTGVLLGVVAAWLTPGLLAGIFLAGVAWLLDAPILGRKLLVRSIVAYFVVVYLLRYYAAPLPIIGVPFSQIFRVEGRFLANEINIGVLDVFLKNVEHLFSGSGHPNVWSPFEAIGYYAVMVTLATPEIALFVETVTAIIGLGIGAVVGPIFIALYVFPFDWCKRLFWAWVHAMIKYSLYRVFAAALVFVWGTAEMGLLNALFGGRVTLAHFIASLLGMMVFNIGAAICCFRLGHFVSDFTGGTAAGGGRVVGPVVSAAAMGARFL